ncbi:MAG TPA: carbamate kinase [Acidimicrobiales bacterium]|nr:carbamate kinase [Acidimicrobiales bacterium]
MPSLARERDSVARVARALAGLADLGELVVTYGADLQLALLVPAARAHSGSPYPLDALEAESEGLVGYLLEQALQDALDGRDVAGVLTRVEVDPLDPHFMQPSLPIGPAVDDQTAGVLAATNGWLMVKDGDGRRRAVPAPEPLRVLETHSIDLLCRAGIVVVCCGGGGIPVVADRSGGYRGVDAVVEKDLSAALLAEVLGADALLFLTDVSGVWVDWGNPGAKLVASTSPAALRSLRFDPRSMGAKVEGACRFAERTGRDAFIGSAEDAGRLLDGSAGTRVSSSSGGIKLVEQGTARSLA